ncbi:uroporphyrinogen-III C-methyltransferase [Paenibacillus sp. JX-17]|uniref:uroporphyrinogen-III C-methyltransferase n=1 Tax=Paenibacillus lacisoli TaxID=3064525 RepID=A0ABT9CGJ4_9BACL|nr:uroporphyrinogen-III C-methyltransferase [Paenibacillus sp. JX-17]MDO7907764.1 uroporphyrinogen-III C-methyltransferase [Paenibacillus sp. JX-17]
MMAGRVSIVGAGPGDPELITVKALRRIHSADVLVYDRLVNEELLQQAAPQEAVRIYCGKAPGQHAMLQEEINKLLIQWAGAGKQVVRLKGGDPLVFGRGGEEALALAEAGIAYEIIPGITSASGMAASTGIPLTHRGMAGSCAMVAGSRCNDSESPVRWDLLAHAVDTLVIYMGMRQIGTIRAQLLLHGKRADMPAAIVEWSTTNRERVVTGTLDQLEKLALAAKIKNPALIVIGEVVQVREELLARCEDFRIQHAVQIS